MLLLKLAKLSAKVILIVAAGIFVVSQIASKPEAVNAYNTVTTEGGWSTGVAIDGVPSYFDGIQEGLAANDSAKEKAKKLAEAADRAAADDGN